MKDGVVIRPEIAGDVPGIRAIHEAAFGGTAEANLVEALREEGHLAFALTAFAGKPIGHIAFPRLTLDGSDLGILALAPLAVLPGWHRDGIGSALVTAALERARAIGADFVFVRGHIAYYPRFGFSRAAIAPFRTPYDDSPVLQGLALTPRGTAAAGVVRYPESFARLL